MFCQKALGFFVVVSELLRLKLCSDWTKVKNWMRKRKFSLMLAFCSMIFFACSLILFCFRSRFHLVWIGPNSDIHRCLSSGSLYRYIPDHLMYAQLRRRLPTKPYEASRYIPPGRIRFHGRLLPAPHDVPAVLRYLYGATYNVTIPYKWKCLLESK